jgi:hypothetical protein
MRTRFVILAVLISAAVTPVVGAAPRKPSPPTAQPDSTVVTPDNAAPPPATGAPINPIQMQPIGPVGSAAAASASPTGQVQMQPIGGAYAATAAPAQQAASSPAAPYGPAQNGSTSSALLAVANGGAASQLRPQAPVSPPSTPVGPVTAVTASPTASTVPPVITRVEQCLRLQAPWAARAETSVKLAVDLLIEDLCGAEVERASLYAHNLDALARFTPGSERAAVSLMGARVDPETGEIDNPPAADVVAAMAAQGYLRDPSPPPQIRRFAAELVLSLHTSPPSPAPPSPRSSTDTRKRH